jgi:carbon monoxide dehydrogenase subunit G
MKFEGRFSIDAPRATVWEAIRDPALMARCVPGCESAEQVGEDRYSAVVGVKIGPISARFNLLIDVEEEIAPRCIRSRATGEEGSRASMLSSHNLLTLEEIAPDRTEVSWSADVNISGRLGKYGLGLMKKKVQSLSDEFVAVFAQRVEAGTIAQ